MKTLIIRCCGNAFGPGYTLGSKDLGLAEYEGELAEDEAAPQKIFHGPLAGQIQTVLAFMRGLNYFPLVIPVISGLGDETLFKELTNSTFRAAVLGGSSNFNATLLAHTNEAIVDWCRLARAAVTQMLYLMNEGDIAVGFFNSPFVELAGYACGAEASGVVGWNELGPMEGLKFVLSDHQDIRVAEKIALATKAQVILV